MNQPSAPPSNLLAPPERLATVQVLSIHAGSSYACVLTDSRTEPVVYLGGNPAYSSAAGGYALPPVVIPPDFKDATVLSISVANDGLFACATTDAATNPIVYWGDNSDYAAGSWGQLAVPSGVNVAGALAAVGKIGAGSAITVCSGNGAVRPSKILRLPLPCDW